MSAPFSPNITDKSLLAVTRALKSDDMEAVATPATPRSQYIALLERDIALDVLKCKVDRLKSEHDRAMRCGSAARLMATLEPWMAAMDEWHAAATELRRDRNAYVLALISENERLAGLVR